MLKSPELKNNQLLHDVYTIAETLKSRQKLLVDQFQSEALYLRPEAQEKLEIIKKWGITFEDTGSYVQLYQRVNATDAGNIYISDPLIYPVPTIYSEENLPQIIKTVINGQGGDIEKAKEILWQSSKSYDSIDHLWEAHFCVAGEPRMQSEHGLRMLRWPLHARFPYGYIARRDEISLPSFKEVETLINQIHPAVIISFAEQIKSGRANDLINNIIKNPDWKPVIGGMTREDYDRKQDELARQYWERKKEVKNI